MRDKINVGVLPAVRIGAPGQGAPLRVDRAELEAWLYANPGEDAR